MNKTELISELTAFCAENNVISTNLYFLFKDDEGNFEIKQADVEAQIQDRLTLLFTDYVKVKFTNNSEISYIGLSEFDERKNVAYRYDYENVLAQLSFLDEIISTPTQSNFNFREGSLDNLFGYLMVTGNETKKISYFRKHHPIDLVRRDRRLYLIKDNERFVQMRNDGFILDKGFDFMKINGDLIIIKPNTLEKYFDFDDVIKAESERALVSIETSQFIENMEEFKTYAETNKPFQKKLIKAKNSPVLQVEFSKISMFISGKDNLKRKLKINEGNTKFILKSAAAKKLFLKLLNDDYLRSAITEIDYDSRAKDILS